MSSGVSRTGGGKAFAKESEVNLTIMSTFTASLKGTQKKEILEFADLGGENMVRLDGYH